MKDTFSVIALVSVMFYQNWKLALFAILMMPLAGGLARTLGKRIGKATAQAGSASGKLVSFLSEILKGSKMIKIYQKEDDENIKANQVIDDVLNPSSKIDDSKYLLEQSFQSPLKEAREHFEKEYLTTQLKKHHGNISKTADFIGMERSALHRKLKSLGIKGIN